MEHAVDMAIGDFGVTDLLAHLFEQKVDFDSVYLASSLL